MIADLSKIKVPLVTSTLSFNILLHVTVFFTILSIFFTTYVSKITSDIINKEVKHILNDIIDKSTDQIKNTLSEKIEKFENIDVKKNIIKKMQQIFPYDYYVNLFSNNDVTRNSINNEVFFYIKFTNILLIMFLILFTLYLVNTNSLNANQIKEICLENVLTFIMVGIIEYLFFTNIAMKYIPTNPSLLFTSFIDGFTKY